ncbi:hypothetical protein ACFPPA_16110 [Rhodanobacter ginsengisoli]|uniref:Uncharacterized protein n=1 Tax=Rhodanobacter ginsengisoli TaxID=418646 RepID=A0ABW0QR49_9GAMM
MALSPLLPQGRRSDREQRTPAGDLFRWFHKRILRRICYKNVIQITQYTLPREEFVRKYEIEMGEKPILNSNLTQKL